MSGAVLDRLRIKYRKLPWREGAFYYCTIPSNGYTFDLQCEDKDNTVRIWKFIGTAPLSKAGRRCEYRNPHYPWAVIGMEVTDEGDVSFYAEQKIEMTDRKSAARIDKMISGYIDMIANSSITLSLWTGSLWEMVLEDCTIRIHLMEEKMDGN